MIQYARSSYYYDNVYLPYISVYREKLPFVRPAPIEEQESKKQKKQQSGKKDKSQKVTDGVDKMAIGDN